MSDAKPESIYKTACGRTLKDPTSYPSAVYRDERVHFLYACLRLHAFEKNTDSFMAGEVEPPIEEV